MIAITPRLRACAAFVTPGGSACDVGTDHAYLPVYLIEQGICRSVIASDIATGPLGFAAQTIAKYHQTDHIILLQSDGLQAVPPDGLTDVVLAGMGGETVSEILGAVEWVKSGMNLILQPMTKAPELRIWLAAHGFSLREEVVVQEEPFLYCVMRVQYTGEVHTLTALEAQLGALDTSQPLPCAYLQAQAARIQRIGQALCHAGKCGEAELQLAAELYKIGGSANDSAGHL